MKCHILNKMVNTLYKGHVRSLQKNLILCSYEQLQTWATSKDSLTSASFAFSAVSIKVLHGFQPLRLLNKSNEAKASLHLTSRMQSIPHLWSLYKLRSHSSVQLRLSVSLDFSSSHLWKKTLWVQHRGCSQYIGRLSSVSQPHAVQISS